jgi:hypothetical protein
VVEARRPDRRAGQQRTIMIPARLPFALPQIGRMLGPVLFRSRLLGQVDIVVDVVGIAGNDLEIGGHKWSRWTDDYSRADGTVPSQSVLENGELVGLGQVVRGGSCTSGLKAARCSFRYWGHPVWFGNDEPKGFRVAADLLHGG